MASIESDQTPIQAFFGNTVLLYLVLFLLVPPMTMRLFAEERRERNDRSAHDRAGLGAGVVLAKYARRARHVRGDVGADGALRRSS